MSPLALQAFELVRAVPKGCCTTYGAIGRLLPTYASGLVVGRWMAVVPPDVPWQRVVGRNGDILTGKKDPRLGEQQRRLLEAEGVPFTEDGRVDLSACYFEPLA